MPSVSDNQEIFVGNIVTGKRHDQNLVSEGTTVDLTRLKTRPVYLSAI